MNIFRPLFRPKTTVFFTLVLLLSVTAFIKVPCPVCDGSGSVSGIPGSEKLSILDTKSQEIKVQRDSCGIYTVFRYKVDVRLLNEGGEDVSGWMKLTLIDPSKDEESGLLDTQYVQISVPAGSVSNESFTVSFGSGLDQFGTTIVKSEIVIGNVPCAACEGSGNISLNLLPFVSSLKTYLNERVQEISPYTPPVYIDWNEYVFFNQ